MSFDKVFNVATAIVTVAAITTIVAHPTSATIIRAIGEAFSSSLRAAMGK